MPAFPVRDTQSILHSCRVLWRATKAEFGGIPAYRPLEAAMLRTLVTMWEIIRIPVEQVQKRLPGEE